MNRATNIVAAIIWLIASTAQGQAQTTPPPATSSLLTGGWKVLEDASDKVYAAQSVTADISFTEGVTHQAGFIRCLKPNYMQLELWDLPAGHAPARLDPAKPHEVYFSDGTTFWKITPDGRMINRPAERDGSNVRCFDTWSNFIPCSDIASELFQAKKLHNDVTWLIHWSDSYALGSDGMGSQNRVMTFAYPQGDTDALRVTLDPDGVICGVAGLDSGQPYELDYHNVRLNVSLHPADFALHKPVFAQAWSKIDPTAKAILDRATRAYLSVNAVSATVMTETHPLSHGVATAVLPETDSAVQFMRPDCWTLTSSTGPPGPSSGQNRWFDQSAVCDGTVVDEYLNPEHTVYKISQPNVVPAPNPGQLIAHFYMQSTAGIVYLDSDWNPDVRSVCYEGTAQWRGKSYRLIKITHDESPYSLDSAHSLTLFVGTDNLIHRTLDDKTHKDGSEDVVDSYFTALDLHPSLSKADFQFTPPAGATKTQQAVGSAPKYMLPIGSEAPDFTVYDSRHNAVHLSDFKDRVVVLDCWATWCGPCQAGLPYTNAVARRFKDKGVVVLGVNVEDSLDAFLAWLPRHKAYDAIQFAVDPTGTAVTTQLNVQEGIPAQFVIGRDGRVVWCNVGFDSSEVAQDPLGAAVRKALAEQ